VTIVKEPGFEIGRIVGREREARGWPVATLAARAGVSRAMVAKVERGEANPTAVFLGKLSGAFGLPLSHLIARAEGELPRSRTTAADQPRWIDPATGYVRRRLSPPADMPLELLELTLPACARVDYPPSAYDFIDQQIWVLDGTLRLESGDEIVDLAAGDCYAFGPPAARTFVNPGASACRYLVAICPRLRAHD
jgi:transcriptional regulator with XRE-family HTH domain